MKIKSFLLMNGPIFLILIGLTFSCKQTSQEEKNGSPVQNFKMTTEIPDGIPANITIPTFEDLMDSHTLWLIANCNTAYTWMWIDLHEGPVVAEVPPKVLGMCNDTWGRYMEDVGMLGPDKGEAGKYIETYPLYYNFK